MESNKSSTTYGLCRCCLTKGTHRDLMKDYYCNGNLEVYSEILVDCFNIFLCNDVRMTTLICSRCVQKLRDAFHFKTKVQVSEKLLLESINTECDKQTVFISCNNNIEPLTEELQEEIKIITIKEEVANGDLDLSHYDFVSEFHNEELLTEKLDFREKALLDRFPKGSLPALPNRPNLQTICTGYFAHLEKLKGRKITAKMLKDSFSPKVKTKPLLSEKSGHITNITTLLTYSNLTAFQRKFNNRYPCFYCSDHFENLQILRDHQKSHNKENLVALVKMKYRPGRPDCLVVYAEVTDLKCTICNQAIPDLNALKTHLSIDHKKKMHLKLTDRVVPLKIFGNGYQCQICNFYFETFGTIEKHMNTHYRNFVCKQCGAGFIAKNRLKIHIYNLHRGIGEFPCQSCRKSFDTRNKLKIHVNLVHEMMKKIKCPKCPARFAYYFVCQKHLVDAHGVTPIKYKCNVCDKAFTRRFPLTNHIKKEHLDEKNKCCQHCNYSCFSNNELKVHMVREHGARLFQCMVCDKSYSSQKSLKQHSKVHRKIL
ncbi:hypothetical protein evm_008392 [Chilo suppressalis]|nr:hypothetical protein evm_008392 [Chilo suppressalis]